MFQPPDSEIQFSKLDCLLGTADLVFGFCSLSHLLFFESVSTNWKMTHKSQSNGV